MSVLTDLADLFPHTVTIKTGTLDAYGRFTPSATIAAKCLIEGDSRIVRDQSTGREQVASYMITVAGHNALRADLCRVTLPAAFNSLPDIQPIRVDSSSDESGVHHEVIYLQ